MGFSTQQYRKRRDQRPWKINPVWRGIGCALMILIPIMAWYATTLFLQSNQKPVLPWELTKVVAIPFTKVAEIDRVILQINRYFDATGFVFGQIFFTIIFSFIGFGIMAFLYAILYKVAGPSRYGPFDVPPNRV
ncbi:MAG: hypothetical protein A2029_13175 [Chloroflexi bacterium RBG_19FT_COMBO_47_9]|nr:MAG: hypothetical protein A2029_13175 [Chloroflexi bacterium RBG_19FT_COMBO_47_9]